ncbi:hypothetical protein PPACK8108_LOCUS20696 [Phakopsora pachyrhizi]|uniref:Uncharacterized protein n=1 Tax=Phakopsora pachyrhizi TaxID=170000 RepID=A0AAV0BHQ9_PHAPC|nr:hypothetical protein PPACK8108_LOCUS20696 [Phakopsora pachyrhizi]
MPLSLLLPKFPETYLPKNFTLLIAMSRHCPQNLPEFDPYSPSIHIADLRDFIYWMNPHVIIPNNFKLDDYRKTAYKLLHPTEDRPSRNRSFITKFNPDDINLRISDLKEFINQVSPSTNIPEFITQLSPGTPIPTKEFILQIDPSSHIPSNTRRAELRDMAYRMIHPQTQPGHRTRSASPAIISIKNFDPYAPHVKKADLREVIFQIDPCSHVPRNIGLSALRDLVYQMIHPCTVNPQASNADKSELRLRSDQLPSRSIKNFDPYAPHINKADLREVIFQIDSNSQIPNNIRLAELRNMAFRMIHPHDSLPQEGKKLFPIFLTMCPISDFS